MQNIWAQRVLTPSGWHNDVTIEIGDDGKFGNISTSPPGDCERYTVIVPAPVNLHSHAFQRTLAGMAESGSPGHQDNFWKWRDTMFRLVGVLTPDDVESVAEMAQLEMLESGFSAVCEFHYLHHDHDGGMYDTPGEMSYRIMAASVTTGIGLTILPVFYEQGGCDGRALQPAQLRFGNSIDTFEALCTDACDMLESCGVDASFGIAMHSLRAVSRNAVMSLPGMYPDNPVHIHVAEQAAEVREVLNHYGKRPVEWLLDNAGIDQRWCLVHCTRMMPWETIALAGTGATAGLCPVTESNLGDGIFDCVRYRNAGGGYGIGTDSNVNISQALEYRTLEYSQRLENRARQQLARNGVLGRTILEESCRGGSTAAGNSSGEIREGSWASMVELDGHDDSIAGLDGDTILDMWMFSGSDRLVRNVWSAGRHVVRDGQHVAREAVKRRYSRVVRRIRDAL